MQRMEVVEFPKTDAFKVIFTGNIGYAQGLDVLPRTAALLKEHGKNVLFCIVGDGRYMEEFKKEIAKLQVEDMFCLTGRKPAEEIPKLLAACDVAFLSFMETKLFEMTIPAKLQSYMACGMPVIAAAAGETERIIKEARCGAYSPSGDEKALAESIEKLMECSEEDVEEMKKNSRAYFEEHFEKKQLMNQMDRYFHENIVD